MTDIDPTPAFDPDKLVELRQAMVAAEERFTEESRAIDGLRTSLNEACEAFYAYARGGEPSLREYLRQVDLRKRNITEFGNGAGAMQQGYAGTGQARVNTTVGY